jgi:serine/threonine-protein kinase
VRTLHVGISDEGRMYQLQDLVEGMSLDWIIRHHEAWPAAHAARIGSVTADALASAHESGIVHRDVKASNVMLTQSAPGVRLLDFGVSKLRDAIGRATLPGAIVGTPAYMAPEQITDADQVDSPVDVYALGVLVHELIAGRPPFEGSVVAMLDRHLSEPPPRLAPELAEAGLAELVYRCLSKRAEDRPTAAHLASALRDIADREDAPPAERLPYPPILGVGEPSQIGTQLGETRTVRLGRAER